MYSKLLMVLFFIFLTVPAFGQVGDTAWVQRYDGPGHSTDRAVSIAVDDDGSAYVTGYSYEGTKDYDYLTIKYESYGDSAWSRRYNGTGNGKDVANAIAVDGDGNVYVTGGSTGAGTADLDIVTIKYDSSGDKVWENRYNPAGDSNDVAYDIAVDGSGNVYVAGESYTTGKGYDCVTIKYNPDGTRAWVRKYNGLADSTDLAVAVGVDGSDNVYVTGWSYYRNETGFDYVTIKYKPTGIEDWSKRYNGSADSTDKAWDIVVGVDGSVYVTGFSCDSVTGADYATIKYSTTGDSLWAQRYSFITYPGPQPQDDKAFDMAMDGSGNIYVTGASYDPLFGANGYYTIKYNENGVPLWEDRYDWEAMGDDVAYAIAVDESGDVYVTGTSYSAGEYEWATIRYHPDWSKSERWVYRYNGPGFGRDEAHDIAILNSWGYAYVTGYSYGGDGTHDDYTTIKYYTYFLGDVNGDFSIDLGDVLLLIAYLYKGGAAPFPIWTGDVDCDEDVDLGDVLYLIAYLYKGGPAPGCD